MRRVVALAVLLVLALTGVGLALAGSPTVLPGGATVAGVEVGGLEATEARRLLERRTSALLHRPVTFVADGARLRLSASQLGVLPDWDAAVDRALADGDGFGPLRGLRRLGLLIGGGPEVRPTVASYPSAVDYALDTLAARVGLAPRAARVAERGGSLVVVAGRIGRVLDREAARQAIVTSLASLRRPATVRLPVVTRRPSVVAADLRPALERLRRALSAPVRLVAGAAALTLTPARLRPLLRLPHGGSREPGIGGHAAERWFTDLARRLSLEPRDAGWEVVDGGAVRVVPSVPGRLVDVPATLERLERAVFGRGSRTAEVAFRAREPGRTTEEARDLGLREVVSSYTTTYGGTPGRLHNVQLVAELVDGALVAPGSTFSFNGVTGERNAAKGFQEAPVIINGELQSGVGGGVCQVSTTVFNAAFEAGLPIVERTNHALYIAHYPLGRDATVNYPDLDLRFVNDTDGWLLVRTRVGAGALTVQLLGRSPHRRVETETDPLTVVGKTPFRTIRDETLPRGTRIVEQLGTHPRATTVRRRVLSEDGTLLSEDAWSSSYVGEPTVVRIGTKGPAKAPAAVAGAAKAEVAAGETGGDGAVIPPPVGAPSPPR